MTDYIIRAQLKSSGKSFLQRQQRILWRRREARHNTSPVATAALGRLLTAGAMMGAMQKGDKDKLTLQIKCSGSIKGLTVTADSKANVKGYVENPDVMLPPSKAGKLDVGRALDMGVLTVIKDMGMKEPYSGQTHLVSGEIAEDLTYYFATSEQVNSSVALGVLMEKDNTVRQAGGFILQLMPFAEEEVIAKLEENLKTLPSVTSMLDEGMTPEMMADKVLEGLDYEVLDKFGTKFYCDCSREKVEKVVISIGKKEIQSLIDEDKPAQVHCHFCNTDYEFTKSELQALLKKAK